MDEAARRLRPADLARLSALRRRREDEAFREARTCAAARDAAEAAHREAQAEVAKRNAARAAGERAIYEELTAGAAVGPAALEEYRAKLDAFGQAVATARGTESERAEAAAVARKAHATALTVHAGRTRETRKWGRAQNHVLAIRRAFAERTAESEADDETLMRIGAARVRA